MSHTNHTTLSLQTAHECIAVAMCPSLKFSLFPLSHNFFQPPFPLSPPFPLFPSRYLSFSYSSIAKMGQNQSLISSSSYGRTLEAIEYLQKEFWLSKSDLQQFFSIFLEIYKMNPQHQHLISVTEFMVYFNIESNSVHKLIFGWLTKQSPLAFSFLEFVTLLCTFLSLSDQEFGKFVFVLFDQNGDGFLEYEEITSLVNLLRKEDNTKLRPFLNILSELTHSERISYTLPNFLIFFHKHTALTNPFRQLKCELQRVIIGSNYWENKLMERLKPNRKESKFGNLERYPVIALEVQEILHLTEKNSSDLESMKRFFPNPKYCPWGGVGNEEKEKPSARQTLPSVSGASSSASGAGSGAGSGANAIKKRRDLRRLTSHDDMLDAETGKLHKQSSERRTLQQQRTQKQLNQVGAIMDVYNTTNSSNIVKLSSTDTSSDLPKIKPRNSSSIDKSASAESHPIALTHCPSIRGSLTPKQPSSANLLPSMSRKGGSMTSPNSPYTPLARDPSGARLLQPLVQPKGVVAAAATRQRKLLRKYSSDDMLR
jgi:Ca2+-binding EF-hand superfamily protein